MSNGYAVIMAGGSGTRFWPASRRYRPKQLLPLGPGNESLLRATVRRIGPVIPPDRTLIVTSEALADAIAEELPEVPRDNVLAEPVGRNTAPCVGWAAAHVRRRDPDGILAVLPADHHVADADAFSQIVSLCLRQAGEGDLVTVGIRPSRPETGYGYLELGEPMEEGVYRARRFVEKPNRQRAEQFLASGRFLWNSGMFFFRADVILEAIREHLPGLGTTLARYDDAAQQGRETDVVRETYADLPSVSIDHGVMEKAGQVVVVPADLGWSDLGSWTTAWELSDKDEHDNALPPEAVAIEAEGCYARAADGKLVALVGVRDLVVVDTEDALLVVPRDRAQDVRQIVDQLEARDDERR
ncbi:MAG: mannose-1-phosphate guanylyltransferase [Polyangiales bacterium]